MMKLYYSAGSCSTSCHISLEESGLPYQAVEVDWDNASDANIPVVTKLNPLGTLPVMEIGGGKHLDQNIAIHSYVADVASASGKNLLPKPGTPERAEAMNWLSFVASDFHKSFTPMFAAEGMAKDPAAQEQIRKFASDHIRANFKYLDEKLAGREYLMGNQFTVADAYCFVVAGWTKWLKIPTDEFKNVHAYLGRVYARPAVQKVLKEEGLLE